jgi:hypothetical protein
VQKDDETAAFEQKRARAIQARDTFNDSFLHWLQLHQPAKPATQEEMATDTPYMMELSPGPSGPPAQPKPKMSLTALLKQRHFQGTLKRTKLVGHMTEVD